MGMMYLYKYHYANLSIWEFILGLDQHNSHDNMIHFQYRHFIYNTAAILLNSLCLLCLLYLNYFDINMAQKYHMLHIPYLYNSNYYN